ncbi:MAG: LamG-like jellyroll fold domain-containing protein [Bacteroidales bacterium]|jgi:hypothetical protein|nr:hypothetical protein [Bacteroidales bacterium]MDY0370353.1 LamG-like jellyroll fold domain-containing protein [Bacteroidales bacterium]
MKKLIGLLLLFVGLGAFTQPGQLSVNRIDQMPDLPFPLSIRDWDQVAKAYDSLVFNLEMSGQYLPLGRLGTQGMYNYTDNIPLFLDTYVGASSHLNQAEAINIMPAIIGASLVGIDKSEQQAYDWVTKARDFFNLKNQQNVYLNNYSATSGHDWWYELMPNVYFYQLRSLYPNLVPEFETQFVSVADRWLWAVSRLGGSTTPWTVPYMNYRAFNLATGLPLTTGVPEPESAGTIAWILYQAYRETGLRKYMEGAQLALDFLREWESNPSYELQLPYGTLIAARMNAVEGTSYPIQTFLDWCFDRGALRGWGAIKGNWGGYDVSGLIGEANDNGNDYAFVMNGFQQVAALAPLPKYDKRYARAVAKWLLNLTNASRLFYWNALPPENQDSYTWASVNDPQACIPYEAMKQTFGGKTPFATGDAIRGGWAATNLSLYSGSSVGYLAAVINKTNVDGVLQIDLNKTDFDGDNTYPAYLYFNPLDTEETIHISLPQGRFEVYEALTETIFPENFSGQFSLTIPAGEARLIRFFDEDKQAEIQDGKLYIENDVLDYHYGYEYSERLRIKALAVDANPVITNAAFTAYCEPDHVPSEDIQYKWYVNDQLLSQSESPTIEITAPSTAGIYILKCELVVNDQTAQDTLHLSVVDRIPEPPVLTAIQSATPYTAIEKTNIFTAIIEPTPGEVLEYEWLVTDGEILHQEENTVVWLAPEEAVCGTISVTATNQDQLSSFLSSGILVKDTSLPEQQPLIWYPFDWDNRNRVADRFHASVSGASKTIDARGMQGLAYRFHNSTDIIYTENQPELNFNKAVSLSCWVQIEQFGSERYIVSHGSWQQRYKLSVTPEGYVRWTVKSDQGVADLDASNPLELNKYYHITAVYTGYSLELYIDGVLDTFAAFFGDILASTKPLTLGRMDISETEYALKGSIDEFRLWETEISPDQIALLPHSWASAEGLDERREGIRIYPNPGQHTLYIENLSKKPIHLIILYLPDGRIYSTYKVQSDEERMNIDLNTIIPGSYLIGFILDDGSRFTQKLLIL